MGQTPLTLTSALGVADGGLRNTCAVCDVCPSAPNIDRSMKDLQRCTASLTRYRMVIKDEMDSSIKRMKQTFAELQSW